ncbi:MAG: hypothetical protein QOJ92_1256 [Frankiales bacterium]|nr:hypothetical protein [Frankiales bacterium]
MRIKTGGDLLTDLFTTVFTGGLASLGCLGGDGPLEFCRVGDYSTQTTTGGAFAFRLRAGDVTSSGGRRRALDISTGLSPVAGEITGPIVSVRVQPKEGDTALSLGKLAVWDGAVQATGAEATTLSWTEPPGTGAVNVRLEESNRGLHVSLANASRPAVLDARVLEDTHPTMTVGANGRISGRKAVWLSAGRQVTGAAGAPASRDVGCSVTLSAGATTAVPGAGCWLDDGQFAAAPRLPRPTSCHAVGTGDGFTETRCVRAPITAATLDLGVPTPLSLLVLRASPEAGSSARSSVVLEGSTDQRSWHRLGEWDGRPPTNQLEITPPDGVTVRYVRLRVDGEPRPQPSYVDNDAAVRADPQAVVSEFRGDLASVAELSVWKGTPRARPTSPVIRHTMQLHRVPLMAIAGVLAALLLGGVGYALGRRRPAG